MRVDFLVVGSGAAGLSFAIKTAMQFPDKKILIITKTVTEETNTKYAQGGIAVVNDFANDSYEKHIEDTLVAGDGLCNKDIVDIVVREGTERVEEIIDWGVDFDKDLEGKFKKGKEGGHGENRILHYKDITGFEIERAMAAKARSLSNIQILENWYVVDIITQHHMGYLVTKVTPDIECYGVYAQNLEDNKVHKILAKITVMASGGNGQVYRSTTNPKVATGDGVAMTYRAKGRIENMEFIQFHPTALYEVGVSPAFLITEAVRGDGGILRNHLGEAFMPKYDIRKDLAPRDIVARAIDNEMKIHGTEFVYLDCTHMDYEKYCEHFPNILKKLESIGIDVRKQYIPVSPAAHYSCGGIKVDEWGRSSIKNMYAAGECSSTGLHGANRLASNSLLEALVFGHRVYEDSKNKIEHIKYNDEIPDWKVMATTMPKEMIVITQSLKELRLLMSDYVGIVRNNSRLEKAMKRLDVLHQEVEEIYRNNIISPQLCELRNQITVSYLIVKGAEFRKESRGLHYNTDFPEESKLIQNIIQ